jgi:hypothetical protein
MAEIVSLYHFLARMHALGRPDGRPPRSVRESGP